MNKTPVEVARYGVIGSFEPSRLLKNDRFAARLDVPSLRNIMIDGSEVAQSITFSVRDKNWGTVGSTGWSTVVEEEHGLIRVEMAGRFVSDHIDLNATVSIRIALDGSIAYGAKAMALRDFERARIGLCVMHSQELAGNQLHVTTPDESYSTVFPLEVSPNRDISNIESLRWALGPSQDVLFEFEGELFELEDQRNWTDASFKTFGTPLSLPWPVTVRSGDETSQQLRISVVGEAVPRRITTAPSRAAATRIRIDFDDVGQPVPPIGVLADIDGSSLGAARDLGARHARVSLDASSDTAAATLIESKEVLAESSTGIELEIVAGHPSEVLALGGLIVDLGECLQRVLVLERRSQITPRTYGPAIDRVRSLTGANVGGGSGSNFAAMNFNIDNIALESLDVLTFPMSPQAHYTDHFSFITNLDAQAVVAANGRRIAGSRHLNIGPVTFVPRRAGDAPAVDVRSSSLVGAGWTVASLAELMTSGADSLTYHHISGPEGMLPDDGSVTPTYHVMANVAALGDARCMPVHFGSTYPRVATVALRRESRALIIVANLEAEAVDIDMPVPPARVAMSALEETTYDMARYDRAAFAANSRPWLGPRLGLLPFGVAILKITFE